MADITLQDNAGNDLNLISEVAPVVTLQDDSSSVAFTLEDAGLAGPQGPPGSSSAASDATSTVKGIVKLTGDLSGTADSPTVPGLALKANTSSLATVATTGAYSDLTGKPTIPTVTGTNTGDETTATIKSKLGITTLSGSNTGDQDLSSYATTASVTSGLATKQNSLTLTTTGTSGAASLVGSTLNIPNYATGGGSVSDASTTTKGIVQLAGDLAGTAASPTVPGLAGKEPTITAGTTAQYYRGDKSWQTLNQDAVPDGTTNKAYTASDKTRLANTSGTNTGDQTIPTSLPPNGTATGDLSGSYPAPTVAKINGTALSGLATGILKNTTSTGVPSIAVAADFPTLNQSTTGSAATLTTGRTIAITGDLAYTSPTFNGSANVTAAGTLATVNANVGTFGSATASSTVTVNAKGLVTAASATTIQIPESQVTNLTTDLAAKVTGTMKLTASTIAPSSPATGDLWCDMN